ncbi:hypothetical protein EMIHUDRAFT_237770 [Emiliania huxleyi CCMP1516]|uniref:AB hydrolase-1 domain-containing protein n=3 Tax=Emiliania huxleyi TaxID=2903 RepID=A0A0D3JPB5_EMIH1|nr:hypothetical protein EMIHUDRAFT_237770 [Emiliania huxleyi CCMP1516]EOD25350.1 hypothetical protein EMIHUDRAFT_237770 [Emiliania huxleyi CCMP1516]|eukprot:XP_005777779.1 hypothetical protein EMIHUDRAFT_237770 [Emiliania huxleyi CCMP1516]
MAAAAAAVVRRTACGVRYSLSAGATSSPLLALVHGAPGSSRDFRHLTDAIERLGAPLRTLSVDLPGHGESPPFPDGREPTQPEMASALWRAVEAATADLSPPPPVLLLGHSIGGHTVLSAAARRPVAGVVLLAPVNVTPHRALLNDTGFRWIVRPLCLLLGRPPWKAALGGLAEAWFKRVLGFPRGVSRAELEWVHRRVAWLDFAAAEADARALRAPVLHAFARDDALIQPGKAMELRRVLDACAARDGPRLDWPSGGHNVQKTRAQELATALTEWVARVAAAGERTSASAS